MVAVKNKHKRKREKVKENWVNIQGREKEGKNANGKTHSIDPCSLSTVPDNVLLVLLTSGF